MEFKKLVSGLFVLIIAASSAEAQAVKDIEGNVYPYVTIGKQSWMAENLRTTKLNDGTEIPLVSDNGKWKSNRSLGYCWLNNKVENKEVYGALYNWYTVNTGKLCPKGWHVPSAAEWNTLITTTGSEEIAGLKLKEEGGEHWKNSLNSSTDEYGFTALPAGMRLWSGEFPIFASNYCVWWTSTGDHSQNLAWNRGLFFSTDRIYKGFESMSSGFSVRCLKDE